MLPTESCHAAIWQFVLLVELRVFTLLKMFLPAFSGNTVNCIVFPFGIDTYTV